MPNEHVTMSEVARRLAVTLPAVSNWRRRHPSFPSPVRVNGQELLFVVGELAAWLDGRKISPKDLHAGELPGTTYGTRFRKTMGLAPVSNGAIFDDVWNAFGRLRGAGGIATLADLVLGLIYLARSDERRWDSILATKGPRRVHAMEQASAEHLPLLRDLHHTRLDLVNDPHDETRLSEIVLLVDRVRRSGKGAEVFEFVLNKFAVTEGRRDAAVHTPAAVVDLLAELADPGPTTDIFDPCCGSGSFLIAAAKYLVRTGTRPDRASYTGHALSERSAALAQMTSRLHGIPMNVDAQADLIFRNDGSLRADKKFDIVLTNPPFDMKRPAWVSRTLLHGPYGDLLRNNRNNFAWLQYAALSLTDRGRAAIVMPGSTLFTEGAEKQIRAKMIDDGIIEAIVALPPQMFSSTGVPVTVWLLNRTRRERSDEILLIDASGLGHMISRTQRSLSNGDQRRIVDTVGRWRAGSEHVDVPGFCASVPVGTIRTHDHVLTPARYVDAVTTVERPAKSMRALRDDLSRLTRRAAEVDEAVERKLDGISAWLS